MNNLVDFDLIQKLYEASEAGVKITLLVRGVCSLVAGVEGMSSNIEAYSTVDKFLEHSRIYVYGNNGNPLYYLSSADMMARNLDHRVEVTCPILDPDIQQELQAHLDFQLRDNVKTRLLDANQNNQYRPQEGKKVRAQVDFYTYLAKLASTNVGRTIFDRYDYLKNTLYPLYQKKCQELYSIILSKYGDFYGFSFLEDKFEHFDRSTLDHHAKEGFIVISSFFKYKEVIDCIEEDNHCSKVLSSLYPELVKIKDIK